jgi:hypothetical protein
VLADGMNCAPDALMRTLARVVAEATRALATR